MYFGSMKDYQYYCIKEKKSLTLEVRLFYYFCIEATMSLLLPLPSMSSL